MGRHLATAALMSLLTTLIAAMALRAADPVLAVAAIAAITVLFAWFAQLRSSDAQSSQGLANPAAILTLAVVGRTAWATALPFIAAHVVGAVLGGLIAIGLDGQLGDTLVFEAPGLVVAAVGAFAIGLLGAWSTLAVDAGAPEAMSAVPAVVGGAVLPLGLLTVFQPAAVLGLAAAGIVPWDVALVAAGSASCAAVVGAFAVSVLVLDE